LAFDDFPDLFKVLEIVGDKGDVSVRGLKDSLLLKVGVEVTA